MFIFTLQLNLYFKNILCKNDCMSIFVTELYDSDICFKKVFKIIRRKRITHKIILGPLV